MFITCLPWDIKAPREQGVCSPRAGCELFCSHGGPGPGTLRKHGLLDTGPRVSLQWPRRHTGSCPRRPFQVRAVPLPSVPSSTSSAAAQLCAWRASRVRVRGLKRLRLFQTRSLLRVEAGDDHTPSAPPDEPPAPLGRFPREQWPWHRSRDTPSTFLWPPLPSCEPCCLQACGGRSMLQPAFAGLDSRPPVVMQEGPCLSGGRAPGTIELHTLRRTRKGPRAVITLSTTWAVLGASDPAGHHPGGSDC